MSTEVSPSPQPDRRALVVELITVLVMSVLPMILVGAFLIGPSAEEPPSPFFRPGVSPDVTRVILGLTYLSFFVGPALAIRRSGQPLSHFGIKWLGPSEFKWGLGGFLVNYFSGWLLWLGYWATNFPFGVESIAAYHYIHATSVGDLVSTWPYYVLVIIFEEQMARCYLITRLRDLTGSAPVAIIGSSLIFASWHGFWGVAGFFHILKAGLVFGCMFHARGSVASPAIAHFVFDALSLLPR